MKRTNDFIIKRYVKQVLQLTPTTYRSRLKKELKSNIFDRFHDTPALRESMICEHFGTPQHFAANYLLSMDNEELQTHFAHSKKQKRAILIMLICSLILLTLITIHMAFEGERHQGYYYSETITRYDTPQPHLVH